MNVKAVVRLNEPEYRPQSFEAHGIAHHDLYFDDGTTPTAAIVRRFLDVVSRCDGMVAVHCRAGLVSAPGT